jgi:hypothetical protein
MLNENGDAGESVPSAAGGGGGSAAFITGHTANVDTYTWLEILNSATASMNFVLEYNTIKPQIDFSQGHTDSRNKVGIFILTGSNFSGTTQITDMGLSTSQYDVVVTASVSDYEFKQGGNNANASASIATAIINNWSSAGAGSVFLGHTNPSGFAPAVLGTFTTGSQGTTIIFTGNTGAVEGGEVDDAQPVSGLSVAATHAATGSMTTTTSGNDTFYDDPGQQIFNGLNSPYSSMPRKY